MNKLIALAMALLAISLPLGTVSAENILNQSTGGKNVIHRLHVVGYIYLSPQKDGSMLDSGYVQGMRMGTIVVGAIGPNAADDTELKRVGIMKLWTPHSLEGPVAAEGPEKFFLGRITVDGETITADVMEKSGSSFTNVGTITLKRWFIAKKAFFFGEAEGEFLGNSKANVIVRVPPRKYKVKEKAMAVTKARTEKLCETSDSDDTCFRAKAVEDAAAGDERGIQAIVEEPTKAKAVIERSAKKYKTSLGRNLPMATKEMVLKTRTAKAAPGRARPLATGSSANIL